jgi:putative SOS response-associated peptidase YedK
MCGRFTLTVTPEAVMELFQLTSAPPLQPRYNIAPSQPVAAVRAAPDGSGRELMLVRWGLIPHWAKDPAIGAKMINARAETVAEKPSFRTAFRRRRCLVPADGYYEWRKEGGQKQPYYIRMAGGGPFALAGLWEHWEGADGSVIESCAILTTDSNEVVRPIHHRMPVILPASTYQTWLDPSLQGGEAVQALLALHPGDDLSAFPVSTHVNRPTNDDERCVAPLEKEAEEP